VSRYKVMHTINGKEYSIFDINKRCAEILAWDSEPNVKSVELGGDGHKCFWVESIGFHAFTIEDYCNNILHTDAIIDKCWNELAGGGDTLFSNWHKIRQDHNCSKLVAACICLIECNGGEL